MLKKIFLIWCLFSFYFFIALASPSLSNAQTWGNCVETEGNAQIASLQCVPVVFSYIVTAALEFVGAVAVILLVYAGIRFITSGGDPKQVQAAQKIITYAIIGLVIVLSSFGIILFISYLTGAKCITTIGFSSCK